MGRGGTAHASPWSPRAQAQALPGSYQAFLERRVAQLEVRDGALRQQGAARQRDLRCAGSGAGHMRGVLRGTKGHIANWEWWRARHCACTRATRAAARPSSTRAHTPRPRPCPRAWSRAAWLRPCEQHANQAPAHSCSSRRACASWRRRWVPCAGSRPRPRSCNSRAGALPVASTCHQQSSGRGGTAQRGPHKHTRHARQGLCSWQLTAGSGGGSSWECTRD